MKQLILISMAFIFAGIVQAQKLKETEVPIAVKQSFATHFPKAKEVKWSKEGTTEFEAEFEIAEIKRSANFDPTGKWLGTETEIKKSELPQAVQATIAKEFAGYKLEEHEKVESPNKAILYEVELEKGKVTYEVQFSADGKVVKKEEKKEGKKEKD